MGATPVRSPGGKIIDGQWTFDAKGANRALELLGKKVGLWRDVEQRPDPAVLLAALNERYRGERVYDA